MECSKVLILVTRSLIALLVLSSNGAAGALSPDGAQNQVTENKKSNPFVATSLILIFIVLDVIAFVLVLLLFRAYLESRKTVKRDERKLDIEKMEERPLEHQVNSLNAGGASEERGKLEFLSEEGGFELRDLLKASAEALGKGNFGACYKAMLGNGASVVVKRLKDLAPFTGDEFSTHVRALSALKHPNLLPPLAFYNSRDERLLVYRFATNGNLFDRIHGGLSQFFSKLSKESFNRYKLH